MRVSDRTFTLMCLPHFAAAHKPLARVIVYLTISRQPGTKNLSPPHTKCDLLAGLTGLSPVSLVSLENFGGER